MKRLILMRHAKSDWRSGQPDIERGINRRGTRSAVAIGDWLRAQGINPDEVLCSAATRTQRTLEHLGLPDDTPVTLTRKLYLAEPDDMFEVLAQASGERVLMLGHNPGSALLAARLVAQPPAHDSFNQYPTCATLVVDFDISDWADLTPGTGTVAHFIVPRELTD